MIDSSSLKCVNPSRIPLVWGNAFGLRFMGCQLRRLPCKQDNSVVEQICESFCEGTLLFVVLKGPHKGKPQFWGFCKRKHTHTHIWFTLLEHVEFLAKKRSSKPLAPCYQTGDLSVAIPRQTHTHTHTHTLDIFFVCSIMLTPDEQTLPVNWGGGPSPEVIHSSPQKVGIP